MTFYKLFYIVHRRADFEKLYRAERELSMPEWYEVKDRKELDAKHRKKLIEMLGVAQVLTMTLDHGFYER